jgi:hypothetical protein
MHTLMAGIWLKVVKLKRVQAGVSTASPGSRKGLQNLYSSVRLRSAPPTYTRPFSSLFRFLRGFFEVPGTNRIILGQTAAHPLELAQLWLFSFGRSPGPEGIPV